MRTLIITLAAATMAATPFAASAFAPKDDDRDYPRADYRDRDDRRAPCRTVYDDRSDRYVCIERSRYAEAEPDRRDNRRDEEGRPCRRSDGTTGLIVGAGTGALLGREIDSSGERTTGTILGGVAGALLGRELERGSCR